jgi:hypothetical protein
MLCSLPFVAMAMIDMHKTKTPRRTLSSAVISSSSAPRGLACLMLCGWIIAARLLQYPAATEEMTYTAFCERTCSLLLQLLSLLGLPKPPNFGPCSLSLSRSAESRRFTHTR